MPADALQNQGRLAQPLLIGLPLVLDHDGQSVKLVRNAARDRIFAGEMGEPQERGQPGLDEHDFSVCSQHSMHFRQCQVEVSGESWKMVQTALNDESVLAPVGEGKLPAIPDMALRGSLILRHEAGREVNSFEAPEAEEVEGAQAVAAATEELDDFGMAGPLVDAERAQALGELANFLLGSFKAQVGRFPWVERDCVCLCGFGSGVQCIALWVPRSPLLQRGAMGRL